MEKIACSICGEPYSRKGIVGHMRWKHGKEWNAPLLESTHKPYVTTLEARVASLEQELQKRGERNSNMDDVLTGKDMEIHELKTTMADMEAELNELRQASSRLAGAETKISQLSRSSADLDQLTKSVKQLRNLKEHAATCTEPDCGVMKMARDIVQQVFELDTPPSFSMTQAAQEIMHKRGYRGVTIQMHWIPQEKRFKPIASPHK